MPSAKADIFRQRQHGYAGVAKISFRQLLAAAVGAGVIHHVQGEIRGGGVAYCLDQEEYLKVFLSDGEVPIDNLASERALRTFTIGRKNWMTINTVRGADASAIIYSVTETARANDLNVYYYMKYLLTELTQVVRADGSIDEKDLEPLMPWSKDLPAECYKRRK